MAESLAARHNMGPPSPQARAGRKGLLATSAGAANGWAAARGVNKRHSGGDRAAAPDTNFSERWRCGDSDLGKSSAYFDHGKQAPQGQARPKPKVPPEMGD